MEDHKIYNISGRKIYTIGGANSTDIEDRLKDNEVRKRKRKLPCWWENEVIEKKYDDGEPSGTAGLPLYNIINKKDLNHILIVVVRYFGGIKLGAGGLLRAYNTAGSDVTK